MNRGDQQTFYPATPGLGLESAFNDNESSFDEFDDQNDDQENTEYENEATEEPVPDTYLPCFREEVRAKKNELKAQYGKGHISIGECGIRPLDPDWRYPNILCLWDCGKEKNASKDCCTFNANQAEKRAGQRDQIARWETCRAENKGIWVPGWRREWRKYKKAGGLKELKQRSTRCIAGYQTGNGPILTPPPPIVHPGAAPLTCAELIRDYNIVPGVSWGYADPAMKNLWTSQGCGNIPVSNCAILKQKYGITEKGKWGTAPVEIRRDFLDKGCTFDSPVVVPIEPSPVLQGRGFEPGKTPIEDSNKNMYIIIASIVVVTLVVMFIIKRRMSA
jgi:hypothetical protein